VSETPPPRPAHSTPARSSPSCPEREDTYCLLPLLGPFYSSAEAVAVEPEEEIW
jgi:hypothetical protein